MPTSSKSGKASIQWVMSKIPAPKTGLDIGCGEGTYAKMFPKLEWTGVEIWEPYVEQYKLKELYQNLFVRDAKGWDSDDHFDVCFLGDVLEHMTAEEAQQMLRKCRRLADTVIISIPLGHYPQGEWGGNPHERHITDNWSDELVKETFGQPTWSCIDNEIGVYVYSIHKIKLTYCVYAISKNEETFVDRFCQSARDVDMILIADTGSTDGTIEAARRNGAVVHDIFISPWRFDLARNAALALVPRSIDICISLDLDEVLEPGWKEMLEKVWVPGKTTRLKYLFDWSCGIRFYSEKIHTRHGYHWHHPCHEYPRPDGRVTEVYAWAGPDLMVSHHPDPTKSRGQYYDLLALSVKEDPHCPRNAFYYARELTYYAKWDEAIEALKRYLAMPNATWVNDRCYAMRLLGKCYSEKGDPATAEKWYLQAAGEAPDTREPWCDLAMLMYRQSRWEECFAMSMRALKIKERQLVYTSDPAAWGHWAHDLASISAWRLGLRDVALEQAREAVEKTSDDPRLKANLEWIENQMAQNE